MNDKKKRELPEEYEGWTSDDWCTPKHLWERLNFIRRVTLDPCSNQWTQNKPPTVYTKEEDGLNKHWFGPHAFVNPPYSNPLPWVQKMVDSYEVTIRTMLLPADTSTRWFKLLWDTCDYLCFSVKREKFVGPFNDSPKSGHVLALWCRWAMYPERFQQAFESWGKVIKLR